MIHYISQHFLTRKLLILLGFKALILIAIIFYAGIELGPDEAQYWTWSRALDWGYYSKPPGIAWQIWMGTKLFGQTEWGVRSLSLFIAFFQAYAVYLLALRTGLFPRSAFWCALIMAFAPLGMMGSLFAITDGGFLLFWTCACLTIVSSLQQEKAPNPLIVGGWILAGALFKWPIYFFWIFFFFCRHWYFPYQKLRSVLPAILLSLAGLLPSLWWNWSHDWATFRHVTATIQGGSSVKATGNVAAFLGSQAILLSPIIFILLLFGFYQWLRQRDKISPALFFCGFVSITSLAIMTIVACFQKIQGNWVLFAYPPALIVLAWDAFQEHPKRALWVKIGLLFSLVLTFFVFLLPTFYTSSLLAEHTPSYRMNPFKHNMGSISLSEALDKQGYQPNKDFLFSDKYQTTSILSFYGQDQKRAYFLNLNGIRRNQFFYWPSLFDEQQGKTGYFVWTENMPHLQRDWNKKLQYYQKELQKYFEKVEFLELAPLVYENSKIVKGAFIFRCNNCKNFKPADSELY